MKVKYVFILTILYTNVIYGQFTHSFFAGPSITKNRLLHYKVEPQEFSNYEGPSYKLFYNLGYTLNYRISNNFGLGVDVQWKKIGSDRLYKYTFPLDTFQNSWQTYISIPLYLVYSPTPKFSFNIGLTSNYRLDEAQHVFGEKAVFNIQNKYKLCFDVLFGFNIYLSKKFDFRLRWEEGIDVIDGEFDPARYTFAVKNRAFHFGLAYKI